MNETVSFILAISCIIPAITGLIKWKKVHRMYHTFFVLMVVSVLSEMIVGIAKLRFNYLQITPPVYNLYFAAEYFLYLVLYKDYKLFNYKTFVILAITGMLLIAFDFIFLEPGKTISVLWKFLAFYAEVVLSAIILFPAIKLLSMQVFKKVPFITNAENFIAIGTIILKSFSILIFSIMLTRVPFLLEILSFNIFQFINPFCYLIFTWAIICIPHKMKYQLL